MRPERALVAARALAQHCPSVLGRGRPVAPVEAAPLLARIGLDLAPALARRLSALTGGDAPKVACGTPAECSFGEVLAGAPGLIACGLLEGGPVKGGGAIVTIEARAVLSLVERAFGGRGSDETALPEAFPISADMMAARLLAIVAEALGDAVPQGAPSRPEIVQRAESLARLDPFAPDRALVTLELTVREAGWPDWQVMLAMTPECLAAPAGATPARSRASHGAANPMAEPFGAVPLTLSATLVDMRVPLSTVGALRPGSVLPVAVARDIPLSIGGTTIARGAAGALDDRVAIRLSGNPAGISRDNSLKGPA